VGKGKGDLLVRFDASTTWGRERESSLDVVSDLESVSELVILPPEK
jgi:hypothetical protein